MKFRASNSCADFSAKMSSRDITAAEMNILELISIYTIRSVYFLSNEYQSSETDEFVSPGLRMY